MKKTVANIALIATLAGGGAVVITDPATRQEVYRIRHGKYEEIKRGTISQDLEVQEYVAPGGAGYQVIEYDVRADGVYWRSYGKGPEQKQRSFDWAVLHPTTATTTL